MNELTMNIDSTYAPLEKRALAALIDAAILLVPCLISGQIMPMIGGLIIWFFYAPILEASELRATLGKYLMGIQVTDMNGGRLSLRVATIRNLLKGISAGILFLGFILAHLSPKKQALHDLLAETLVVNGKSNRPVVDAWLESVKTLTQSDTTSQLERLQALREKGVLTEEEFQEQKRKILAGSDFK